MFKRDVFGIQFGLLAVYLLLLGLGIVVFYGSGISAYDSLGGLMTRKLSHVVIGIGALILGASIPYSYYQRFGWVFLVGSVVLLILPFVPGLGVNRYGATRWLNLGVTEVQPSELVKVAFVIYLAGFVSRKREGLRDWRIGILPNVVTGIIIFGLMMMEPDLGSAIIFIAMIGILLFLGNARLVHLAGIVVAGVVMASLMVVMSAERRGRFQCVLFPQECPESESYHLDHAQWAFGSGGAYGIGLGKGIQTNQGFVLKPQSDFVFAVIGEELGFVGTAVVILCFVLLFLLAASISQRAPDEFGRFLALGLGTLLTLHALIHIGVTMRLLPTKGLCLPLLSAGGSALIAHSYAVGVMLNVSAAGRQALREGQGTAVARQSVWHKLKGSTGDKK